jgi:hypothetical protein
VIRLWVGGPRNRGPMSGMGKILLEIFLLSEVSKLPLGHNCALVLCGLEFLPRLTTPVHLLLNLEMSDSVLTVLNML